MDYNNLIFNSKSTLNGNVIINLVGGLCNQMFQISVAYSLCLKYNKNLIIKKKNKNHHSDINYFENIFSKINLNNQMIVNTNYVYILLFLEPGDGSLLHFDIPNHDNIELSGYFQNEQYFFNRDTILKLFEIDLEREILLKNKYLDIFDSYFIHIRRGDYLNSDLHNINLETYYQHAIKYILSIDPNAIFYVFSDDISYCKAMSWLEYPNIKFIIDLDEINSLYLISMCNKGGIGSNSSYSWWGGYLNTNINKIVIYPNKWFNAYWKVDIGWNGCYIMNIDNFEISKKINTL